VAAQLELDFNSVERIAEYLHVPEEAPAVITNSRPPAYWPASSGGLVVDNLTVSYTTESPVVLDHLSFDVKPKEKIGVVWSILFVP
jgi:ABC-type multidrug transport system fused ATPase/permease subunit